MKKDNNRISMAFEEAVIDVLHQKCLEDKKHPLLRGQVIKNKQDQYEFDAYADEGITDNNPTYVEVKYNTNKSNLSKWIKRINNDKILSNKKILLVTNNEKDKMLVDNQKNGNIQILSAKDVFELAKNKPVAREKMLYLSNEQKDISEIKLYDFEQENERYKQKLFEDLKKSKFSIVLGAGVSLDYKIRSWRGIVDFIYDKLDISKQFIDSEKSFEKIGNDCLCKSQYAKQNLFKKDYPKVLYNSIYDLYDKFYQTILIDESFSLVQIAKLLARNSNVNKVITYNYDNLLELLLNNYKINYKTMVSNEDFLSGGMPIYHVHGYMPHGINDNIKEYYSRNIVLTEDEYFKLYNNSSHWQVAIQLETYKDDVCLFIGNSITDYNEKKLLNYTRQQKKVHYALFLKDDLDIQDIVKISAYFATTCGVQPIWLNSPKDLSDFLRKIS